MKFLKLTIEGITSIKSKIIIDFKKDLFNEDLFAITGQTGSGKSSILNAISLALYNTGHKKITPEEYVSLGSEKGIISLDFSINSVIYSAYWECRMTSKSGKSIKPVVINTLKREGQYINKRAEEIIGLSSKQFFKTIIINQGKFNEFLSAPFKDRKILLEQIYGTDNLSGLSTFIKRKIKELENEKIIIESKMEGSIPFTEELYTEKKDKIINFKLKHENIKNNITPFDLLKMQLDEIIKYLININKDQVIIDDLNIQFDKIKIKYNDSFEKFNESESKNKSLLAQSVKDLPVLKNIESINNQIKEFTNKNIYLDDKLKTLSEKVISTSDEIKEQEMLTNDLKEELKSYSSSPLDKLTKTEIGEVQKLITKLNNDFTKSQLFKSTIISKENKQKLIKEEGIQHRKDHDSLLEKLNIKQLSNFSEVIDKLNFIEENLIKEESSSQIGFIHKENKLNEQLKHEKESLENTLLINKNFTQIEEHNLTCRLLKKEIQILQKEEELNILNQSIQRCKEKALHDSLCPICDNGNLEKLDLDITKEENKLCITNKKETIKKLKQKEKSLTELESNIKILKKDNQSFTRSNKKINSEIQTYLKEITIDFTITNENKRETALQDIKSIITKQHNDSTSLYKIKIKEIRKKIQLLQKDFQRLIEVDQSLNNSKTEYSSMQKEVIKTREDFKNSEIEIKSNTAKISKILSVETLPMNFKDDYESLRQTHFKKYDCINNIEQNAKAKLKLIEHRDVYKEELQKTNLSIKENKVSITKLNSKSKLILKGTKFKSSEEGLNFYENSLNDSRKKLDKDKSSYFELSNKRDILSSNLNIKKENITQQKLECTKLQSMITLFNFDLYKDEFNEKIEIFKSFYKFGIKLKDRKFQEFCYEDHSYLTSVLKTVIIPLHELLITNSEDLRDQIITLRTEIKQYEDKIKSLSKLNNLEEKISYKLNRQRNLLEALGKDDFGRFAASLIEQQLIQLCNKEMEALCEARYEILQLEKNKTSGPEFFVIDHWREAQLRNVSTLSGGETFLVSLAMALGLAEMTRGKVEIESFFIDEGFGTLDEDSIEEVLNILLTIRSRGKQIGIISHITSLTDRIPVRICLEKDQWGESTLNITQN